MQKKLMGFKCYINLKQTKESDNSVQTTDVLILRLFYRDEMSKTHSDGYIVQEQFEF